MTQRIVASIEARMGSSRLPGKMLADLGGVSTIALIARRVRMAERIDDAVVATTDSPADDPLAAAAEAEGMAVFRGSEDDVLDRVVRAQQMMRSDVVVEINGDCPLLDPAIINRAVERFAAGNCDLVTTTAAQSYPEGMDVQVFALPELEWVAENISDADVREHVSLYFYQHPERYRIANLDAPAGLAAPELRLLLDYPDDLARLRAIHTALAPVHGDAYSLADVMALLSAPAGKAAAR